MFQWEKYGQYNTHASILAFKIYYRLLSVVNFAFMEKYHYMTSYITGCDEWSAEWHDSAFNAYSKKYLPSFSHDTLVFVSVFQEVNTNTEILSNAWHNDALIVTPNIIHKCMRHAIVRMCTTNCFQWKDGRACNLPLYS